MTAQKRSRREMVQLAGGRDVLAKSGEPSVKVGWREVIEAQPDSIFLMPCGFDTRRAVKEAAPLRELPGWNELPAVRTHRVFALNGNAYFSRPGPRLVNGLEILAQLIHPGESEPAPLPADSETLN